ncbi:MAG: 2Fe-2S iron-sulfur cluster-binding protein, partial [Candidatus Binatia bacterium]
YYRVSIKRLPAPADPPGLPPGLSSNYFHDHVQPGTRLCVKAPRGKFYLDPSDTTPVVLLSGGVGLTPMISMLNAIVESGSKRPVWFVHGTRDGREHAMGAHSRRMAVENANVNVHVSYSQPRSEDSEGSDYDSRGYVTIDLLKRVLPPAAYDFYLCGPTAFMKSLYNGLLEWGVPPSRVYYEFFGPVSQLVEGTQPADRKATPSKAAGEFDVRFAKSGLTAKWDPTMESILDLAEAHGLRPAFSCRTGICHTCSSKLVEGQVEYVTEPLDLPDPGCVLICCAQPKTDVVIEV